MTCLLLSGGISGEVECGSSVGKEHGSSDDVFYMFRNCVHPGYVPLIECGNWDGVFPYLNGKVCSFLNYATILRLEYTSQALSVSRAPFRGAIHVGA